MKIVDAAWEKRNLLLETKEIIVQEGDTTEELEEALRNSNEEYVVVKLPLTEIEKKFLLTDYGYTHVELMADLESENVLSPLDAGMRHPYADSRNAGSGDQQESHPHQSG